jgi:ribosomal-protein-alanine N-acetyltransferase
LHEISTNNETIRELKEDDIEEILDIEKRSFISPWTKRLFEETLSSPISTNFVLKKGNTILGYIIMYSVGNEVHILNIAVHPDYRKKGYGSKLVTHVLTHFRGSDVVEFFLEVREGNSRAINLYKKYGFEVIGKRKKYYMETNEDALVMQLTLSANVSDIRENHG